MKQNSLIHLPFPLVLASQSPRRQALLSQIGLEFSIAPAHLDEEWHAGERAPQHYAEHLAAVKAREIARLHPDSAVLGADTIVVLDGQILNKPRDADDACRMLSMLSNRQHQVITGLCLCWPGNELIRSKSTSVHFRELKNSEIEAYVAGGSPMDKAGSYGIQDDYGAVFVHHIEGCYYNIVGLPLELLYEMLQEMRSRAMSSSDEESANTAKNND